MSIATMIADTDRRTEMFRAEASGLLIKAAGQPTALSGSGAYGGASGGGQNPFGDAGQTGQFLRLYRASLRDHLYTAIRPVAVKVAEQSLKIGRKSSALPTPGGIMTKELRQEKQYAPEFVVKAIDSEGVEIVQGHFLDEMLNNPNPYSTRWALLYCTAYSLEAAGEAIWWMDYDESGGRSIWYLPRHWVRPIQVGDDPFGAWKLQIPGVAADLPPIPGVDVVRFSYPNPLDPTASHSPTASQARAVNTDDHIQDAQLAGMKNAIRPTLAIEIGDVMPVPGGGTMRPELTPEQRKQVIEAIRLAYRGAMHTGDPIILDALIAGIHPVFPNPAEMDFPNSSGLTERRIKEGIGVNPIVTGRVEGANRASAYVAQDTLYELVVNPLLELISQVMTQKIGPRVAAAGERLLIWLTKPKPRDADLQLKQLQIGMSTMAVRPNEYREAVGLPPDDKIEAAWERKLEASVKSAELAANLPPPPASSPAPGSSAPPAGPAAKPPKKSKPKKAPARA